MKALLLLALVLIVVGAGLRMAGVDLPLVDYPLGPIGVEGGPDMPNVRIEPPGFDDFPAP